VKTAQEWRSAFWNTPCSCGVATMAAHCRDCSTKVFELAMADARASAFEDAAAFVEENMTGTGRELLAAALRVKP
jgi:hypothetical protein